MIPNKIFRATPKAHGSFQAKGRIRATAAGLHHSSRQCQILNPLSGAKDQTHVLMDVRFVTVEPQWELLILNNFKSIYQNSFLHICCYPHYKWMVSCWPVPRLNPNNTPSIILICVVPMLNLARYCCVFHDNSILPHSPLTIAKPLSVPWGGKVLLTY